ncbi:hypothetical protein CHS0354_010218 [Potamilus streckersoni]|uniref:Uncharacterized protein n=1 Tax=Potamilus streckersoni TaxID=2493646 RepID=A0AAE0RSM6_9BIVA|nr:hypothetical protein CHS0354_010218 [Potamilus streckersoni]
MPTLPTTLHTSSGNTAGLMNGAPPPLVSPTEAPSGLIYNPYEYPYSFSPATAIFEYPGMIEQSAAGAVPKVRRTLASVRDHPYAPVRVSLP